MKKELTNLFIDAKSIVILGDIGAGKTACAFKILELCKGTRQVYFLDHPKPELLSPFGYQNLTTIEDIALGEGNIIVLDEIQLSMEPKERDTILSKVLSLSRQRNNLIILITSDSRTLSPVVESYIDFWVIKDYEYSMTKQRSKVRQIIKDHVMIVPKGFSKQVNEMVVYCRRLKNQILVKDTYFFDLPNGWSEKLSRSYAEDVREDTKNSDDKVSTREKLMKNSQETQETHSTQITQLPSELNNSLNNNSLNILTQDITLQSIEEAKKLEKNHSQLR